jgi:hypothetical protein
MVIIDRILILSHFTSTICNWNQNNEKKKKLYCSFLVVLDFIFTNINLESEQNQLLNFILIDQCYFIEFDN